MCALMILYVCPNVINFARKVFISSPKGFIYFYIFARKVFIYFYIFAQSKSMFNKNGRFCLVLMFSYNTDDILDP